MEGLELKGVDLARGLVEAGHGEGSARRLVSIREGLPDQVRTHVEARALGM